MVYKIAVIVFACLLWKVYLAYKDRFEPEPIPDLLLTFVSGAAAAVACFYLFDVVESLVLTRDVMYLIDHDRVGFLGYSLGVIGPLEECCKIFPFLLICTRLRAFGNVTDGIIYASFIGLGFACVENFIFMEYLEGPGLYLRSLTSPLVHMLFASIWGYAYAKARYAGRSTVLPTLLGLLIASLAHGFYDFLATDPALMVGSAIIIAIIWCTMIWKLGKLAPKQAS